jgi:dihydroorotate dehydrogenase (NAD+) catalytic subunit
LKVDLLFDPPLMNAAGTLGFSPDIHSLPELGKLGAFVTNPLSLKPRRAAQGVRWLPWAGGFWMHTGYPNPGLRTALKRFSAQWRGAPLPVIVHLLVKQPAEVHEMIRRLEGLGGIAGVELGLPPDVTAREAVEMIQRAAGELPLIVRLPLERAFELASGIISGMERKPDELISTSLAAFSLGPPRGALPHPDQGVVRGRIYGPAIFPLALAALQELEPLGVALIGAGGVYSQDHVQAMLDAGASAVQLDALLWRGGWLS